MNEARGENVDGNDRGRARQRSRSTAPSSFYAPFVFWGRIASQGPAIQTDSMLQGLAKPSSGGAAQKSAN